MSWEQSVLMSVMLISGILFLINNFFSISSKYSILESSKKLIAIIVFLKLLSIIFLYFALQEQPSTFYVINRWVLSFLFLIISVLYIYRAKYYFSYLFIPLFTIVNPIVPLYFHNFNVWIDIDKAFICIIVISIITLDIIFYNSPLEQVNIIYRSLMKPFNQNGAIKNLLLYNVESEFRKGMNPKNANKKGYHLIVSKELIEILIDYDRYNPEFFIKKAIILKKLPITAYIMESSKDSLEYAKDYDNRISIPSEDEISKLNFDNYEEILYKSKKV